MRRVQWVVVAIAGLLLVLVLLVILSLVLGWRSGMWGRMMPGPMGPGMMDNWGFGLRGWLGMAVMVLIPLGVIALIVLGIVGLVIAITRSQGPPTATRSCPNCGRAVQADWRNCPYCGQVLT